MSEQYTKTSLHDGTQVKITHRLAQQIKEYESQGCHYSFIDFLMVKDDEMINQNRVYNEHNEPFDETTESQGMHSNCDSPIEEQIIHEELSESVQNVLNQCTEIQRRRYLMRYERGLSLEAIARKENRSKQSVEESINQVRILLTKCELL